MMRSLFCARGRLASLTTAALLGFTMTVAGAILSAGMAEAQTHCGSVRLPGIDAFKAVTITSGALTCNEAGSVIERYIADPNLERMGNTQAAEFLGWLCVTPTATSAEINGYSMICNRGADEIQVAY